MGELDEIKKDVTNCLHLPVEQIGTWLWVENTNDLLVEKTLLKWGFNKSNFRNMYYYRKPLNNRVRLSMDQLRHKYNNNSIGFKTTK